MKCPLCGGFCPTTGDAGRNSVRFNCQKFNRSFRLNVSAAFPQDEGMQRRMNNLIFEKVIHEPYADRQKTFWHFFYDKTTWQNDGVVYQDEEINLADIPYPKDMGEKIDRALMNLYYVNSSIGYNFGLDHSMARAIFAETVDEEDKGGIGFLMKELEYLSSEYTGFYKIAIKGWQRIDEIIRKKEGKRQAFIAMAFRPETTSIREAIKKGIKTVGYTGLAIDEKEHNNQIVPEIFDEIDQSKFLVMDVTIPNYGAYYEAGYALGKGKQVIICCRKDTFDDSNMNRPHFDIAQKAMVVWETEDALVEKLSRRIKATVK